MLNFDTVQLLLQHGADLGLRAACIFTGRSKFLHRSLERRDYVTPSELLGKLWLAYSETGRYRALRIRKLLEGAVSR